MSERFVTYWLGYANQGMELSAVPSEIGYVNLFLIGLNPTTTVGTNYISSDGYSFDQILDWAHQLQARGQKVMASLMSNSSLTWNEIPDPSAFAQSLAEIVLEQWGLDGVDIDPEQSEGIAPNSTFISVVQEIRAAFGSDKIVSYVSYVYDNDSALLKACASALDYVSLMGYFWSFDEMVRQFQTYTQVVDPANLLYGVSPSQTSPSETSQLAAWEPKQGSKGGMMLFDINNDPNGQYVKAITSHMPGISQRRSSAR